MWLKIGIFLLFMGQSVIANPVVVDLQNFDDSQLISCTFLAPQEPFDYTCNLLLQNPLGRDNFTTIAGEHIEGFTDNDVLSVFGVYQNSLNFPQIICQTFPNTLDIIMQMSQIQVLGPNTFVDCLNLEFLMFGANMIASIPDGLFRNNQRLQVILMNDNRLREIGPNAFTNTAASYIDLSSNRLWMYDPSWVSPVNETLEILLLNRNEITYLPLLPFNNLGNLRELDISRNPLSYVDSFSFLGLRSLRRLYLSDLRQTSINPIWFTDLTSLTHLFLGYNRIREINENDFDGLTNLTELVLNNNDLTFVNTNGLGQSLTNLNLMNNRIIAIDQEFFDRTENLQWLLLNGNDCLNQNFYNVGEDRENIRERLSTCFQNFIGSARCSMFDLDPYPYECVLFIMNPTGRDFESIEIEHSPGKGDEDVIVVEAVSQHTRNFPSIICRQFPNVDFVYMMQNEIEIIGADSFVDCSNLWRLVLGYNRITSIPDNTFNNNPSLQILEVFVNRIESVGNLAFTGSGIRTLALSHNLIRVFNPEPYIAIEGTLRELFLNDNQIFQIPSAGFSRLSQLRSIDLSQNRIPFIPSNAFRFLSNLEHLELMNLGLSEIEPEWFEDLYALFDLRLDGNNFYSIPPNAFNNLRALTTFSIANNQMRNLHANSFGSSLNSLVHLLAPNNIIRTIDSSIIDNTPNLRMFHLNNNYCANLNINNVQGNVDEVREQLAECFRMFEGFMRCSYYDYNVYFCRLTILNVQPRNDWLEIPGEHAEDRSNDDVSLMEAYMQETANVPSIICQQFRNLTEMQVRMSFLDTIDEEMFEDCTNLKRLMLTSNLLRQISDFTFINSPEIESIDFYMNRINHIGPNAFINLRLFHLRLDRNELVEFNPQWVASSHETLIYLYISQNRIQELVENSFAGLVNLLILDISSNPLRRIPSTLFDGLDSLTALYIDRCGLTDVDARWFVNLRSLSFVSLFGNELTNLRPGVFDNLESLTEIDLGENRLTMLHADSFGSTLANLTYLFFDKNRINDIDQQFFDEAGQLVLLFLLDNLCVNMNFYNVDMNRNEALMSLSDCFTNFNAPGVLVCNYLDNPEYTCVLNVVNPNGHEFSEISGTHSNGMTNSDVRIIESAYQNTRLVPSIMCDEFENLHSISIQSSQVHRLTEASFRNCRNLERINLNYNLITTIDSSALSDLPNLATFEAQMNQIHHLAPAAFTGTAMQSLLLGGNRIRDLRSENWQGIEGTLSELQLFGNILVNLDENSFDSLVNLAALDLGLNAGLRLAPNAFRSLAGLRILMIDNSEIEILHPEWFSSLPNITELFIQQNNIRVLPPGIFSTLISLTEISLGGNSFESLNSDAFGDNLSQIRHISAMNGQIGAIDERILDIAGSTLSALYLYGNECSNENFYDVSGDLDAVRESLEACFSNFRGSIECHYLDFAGTYTCIMLLQNIAGHDQFSVIPGEHEGNSGDADVRLIESMLQNSRTIPSVICTQFPNVEEISLEESRVERVTVGECVNLQTLRLGYNRIESIEAGTFENNPNLRFLDLRLNRLMRIDDDAFAGSGLINLDLSSNRLLTFNPLWVSSIVGTLEKLELYENSILSLDENTFATLTNLRLLDLGLNPNIALPPTLFSPLTSLTELFIDSNRLRRVENGWFAALSGLTDLHLHSNSLRSLPVNAFSPLTNLAYLSLRNNRLSVISGDSFGDQMQNLTRLYAQSNRINEIDAQFFDSVSGQLENLYLYDNLCVNTNFYNVNLNREMVRDELQTCFDNFSGN